MRKLMLGLALLLAACGGSSAVAARKTAPPAPATAPVTTAPSPATSIDRSGWSPADENLAWAAFQRGKGGGQFDRQCTLDVIEYEYPELSALNGALPEEVRQLGNEIASHCAR